MYSCSNCGTALNPDGVCPNCGTAHNIQQAAPVQQAAPAYAAGEGTLAKKSPAGGIFAVIAAIAVVAVLVWFFVLSPSGAEKVALDYAKKEMSMGVETIKEMGGSAKTNCSVAYKNAGKNLYVIDATIEMSYEGVSVKGGTMVVVKVDGKDAYDVRSYEYGDTSYGTTKSEALADAKEYVNDY
jgi:hypothetical protein